MLKIWELIIKNLKIYIIYKIVEIIEQYSNSNTLNEQNY